MCASSTTLFATNEAISVSHQRGCLFRFHQEINNSIPTSFVQSLVHVTSMLRCDFCELFLYSMESITVSRNSVPVISHVSLSSFIPGYSLQMM